MGFLEILTIIGCILFLVIPAVPAFFFARTGVKERDLRTTCPKCGQTISYGTTKCPRCWRTISTSDVVMRSGYLKNGFKLKGMRFLIVYAIVLALETALLIWIL